MAGQSWYDIPLYWYPVPVAFNVKDDEVIRLADELAKRLHLPSRIDAIRHALRAQIAVTQSRTGNRADELLEVLNAEIWPMLTDRSPVTKSERERALGYDSATGV
jgi:antitoxin VapB